MTEESFIEQCSPNFVRFFKYAKKYCSKHNKKIIVCNQKRLYLNGVKCAGWCDGNEMAIAFKNPLFEEVFVHEFCHMQQAIEKSPLWKEEFIFWDKLEKKKINLKNWNDVLEVMLLERDCEARAIKFSKRYGLFNNTAYAKKANIYLLFYQYVFLKHRWKDSTSIYSNMELYKKVPSKLFSAKQLSHIDMNLMLLFDQ